MREVWAEGEVTKAAAKDPLVNGIHGKGMVSVCVCM